MKQKVGPFRKPGSYSASHMLLPVFRPAGGKFTGSQNRGKTGPSEDGIVPFPQLPRCLKPGSGPYSLFWVRPTVGS